MRTTPNREMCVRGEAAWVREVCLPNARAESGKFRSGFAPAFRLVLDDSYREATSPEVKSGNLPFGFIASRAHDIDFWGGESRECGKSWLGKLHVTTGGEPFENLVAKTGGNTVWKTVWNNV